MPASLSNYKRTHFISYPASKLLLLFISLVCVVSLYATNTNNDSLQSYFNRLDEIIKKKDQYPIAFLDTEFLMGAKESATGKEKVDLLLQLYTAYVYISREEAFRYNEEAKLLSKNIGFKKGQLQAAYNAAYLMFVRGEFDEAFNEILEIEKDLKGMPFMEIKADITNLKSDIYTERGEYGKALELGLGLLQVAENTADDYMLMRAYAALSHYYLRMGNYPKARSYCLRGLDYIIKLKKTEYFYHKINEIARMTAKIEGPERALEVYSFFFELEEKMTPPGDYVKSITYMILSDIYMSIDKLDWAQYYLSKALRMNYKNDFRFRIPRALIQQGELHLKKEDTLNAILNYKKSIEAAERINAFDVMKSSSAILSGLYRKSNQFSKSFEYQTLHNAIVDSHFTNEQDQKIKILEAKQSIKEMSQQKQILELKSKAQQGRYNSIATLLACLFLLCCLILYGYLKVKEKNKLLYERTIELAKVQLEMKEKLERYQNDGQSVKNHSKNLKSQSLGAPIDDEVKDIILARLEKLENENFFIEPKCNLHQLSDVLKTNPKYLSQVINQEKKSNFNNYINGLRINYLLPKLLKDLEFRNSKLSYIAASIGYNNLNTFNAAFKKRLGILPSYFINQLNSVPREEVLRRFNFREIKISRTLP